jgi:hypothetical protein
MSVVRYFKPENRLAKIIVAPGGKSVEAAVEDAKAGLLQISDACLEQIDEALARTYRLCERAPTQAEIAELYTSVRDIAGLAQIGGLPDLGVAALSFCALLDHAQNGGRLTRAHIEVHLNVLRILRHPEAIPEADRSKVLENLDVMVEKLAGKGAAEAG